MRIIVLSRIPKAKIKMIDTRCTKEILRPLQHKDLMNIALTIKILDIEQVNADPSQIEHLISQETHLEKVILMIGITTQGIVVTIVKNVDMFLKIV